MEHRLRLEGKWDEYENRKVKENALAWLAEAERDKNVVAEELSKVDFANSFGDSEKWNVPVTKEELLEKIEKEFEEFRKNFIAKLENGETNEGVNSRASSTNE
jgi:phosphomannomutase